MFTLVGNMRTHGRQPFESIISHSSPHSGIAEKIVRDAKARNKGHAVINVLLFISFPLNLPLMTPAMVKQKSPQRVHRPLEASKTSKYCAKPLPIAHSLMCFESGIGFIISRQGWFFLAKINKVCQGKAKKHYCVVALEIVFYLDYLASICKFIIIKICYEYLKVWKSIGNKCI